VNDTRERRPANDEEVDFAGEKLVQKGRDFRHIAAGSAGDQRKIFLLAQTFAGEPSQERDATQFCYRFWARIDKAYLRDCLWLRSCGKRP
jgi:hypothetical protein